MGLCLTRKVRRLATCEEGCLGTISLIGHDGNASGTESKSEVKSKQGDLENAGHKLCIRYRCMEISEPGCLQDG